MDRLLFKRAVVLASCTVLLTVSFGCQGRDLRVPPPSYSDQGLMPGQDAGAYPGYEGATPSGVGSPYQSPEMGSSAELGSAGMSNPYGSSETASNPYGTASEAYNVGSATEGDPYGNPSMNSPYGSMGTSNPAPADSGAMPSQYGGYSIPSPGAAPSMPEELPEMAPIPGGYE